MTASTVEELQQALADAGRSADGVPWDDDPERVAQEGVHVVRREREGVVTVLVSRGRDILPEQYDSEAVRALHARLLDGPGPRVRARHAPQGLTRAGRGAGRPPSRAVSA